MCCVLHKSTYQANKCVHCLYWFIMITFWSLELVLYFEVKNVEVSAPLEALDLFTLVVTCLRSHLRAFLCCVSIFMAFLYRQRAQQDDCCDVIMWGQIQLMNDELSPEDNFTRCHSVQCEGIMSITLTVRTLKSA